MTTDIQEAVQRTVSSAAVVLRNAEGMKITTNEEYQGAALTLREIVTRQKDLEDERKRILRPLDESRKQIMALFAPAQENLAQAERYVKGEIGTWRQEQERRRRAEEARLAEVARKEADRLAARAKKAEEAGHYEKAAVLAGAAEAVIAPEVEPPRKAHGISTRQSYKANVIDKVAFIKAVADGIVPEDAVDVNMPYLNQAARALKTDLRWPGVEVAIEEIVVAQSGLQTDRSMYGGTR